MVISSSENVPSSKWTGVFIPASRSSIASSIEATPKASTLSERALETPIAP